MHGYRAARDMQKPGNLALFDGWIILYDFQNFFFFVCHDV